MQLQFIPFKVGSLRSNTAIPSLLPHFIAVEEFFTWDFQSSSQLPGRFKLSQYGVLFDLRELCPVLIFGNKKKSHGATSGLYGGWGSVVILFWVKNSLIANNVTWRIVVVKEPLVCKFTPHAPNSVSQTPEYLYVKCLIHSLSRWNKTLVNNSLWIKKHEHGFLS